MPVAVGSRRFPPPWTIEDKAFAHCLTNFGLGCGRSSWPSQRAKGFRWSTRESDTQCALGLSETNGPCPFIPQKSKALEKSSPAPVRERSC